MSVSLELNPDIVRQLRAASESAEYRGSHSLAALLHLAAMQLEHTHKIATAGWLETQEEAL